MLEIFMGVCFAACVAYYFETLRMRVAINHICFLNKKIMDEIGDLTSPYSEVDVFVVNDIRTYLKKNYVKEGIIDDFRVFLIGGGKIRLLYRIGFAVQKVEIYIENNDHDIKELDVEYNDNPFEINQLL